MDLLCPKHYLFPLWLNHKEPRNFKHISGQDEPRPELIILLLLSDNSPNSFTQALGCLFMAEKCTLVLPIIRIASLMCSTCITAKVRSQFHLKSNIPY